jgi:HK97 family phage major capsid protein
VTIDGEPMAFAGWAHRDHSFGGERDWDKFWRWTYLSGRVGERVDESLWFNAVEIRFGAEFPPIHIGCVGERETRTDTGDPAYGMISIDAPEMFARARISQQMLEDSDYDLLAELREEFSTQFALKEGLEFLEGAGAANQAEGLLTAAGVTEVVSGHASEIKADALINIYYGLKSFYTGNARWLLNRLTVRDIRKLKDGNGVFIWAPGIAGATPNTILGTPYVEIPGMDNVGAGNYPVIFGDIKRAYTVVDRIGMQMQTDFTTGADDGIVIFRARKRVGGGTVQPEAYQKLKIAAS